ncbi:transcriptional regulator [Alkalihalobacillus alcalophilus ATCC 27647 = CGMCC 1.3604]|uniref:Transcriptional regulator n=1 Tax=Alkalihalobacillus alcalophilus ATCC 27647 = CGMCC 1.3604 TaxID=1218173 RepID=A0A094WNI5_ALKAL|nr:response regulator [Alkalihalobacillus alcalophilus]KGA97533.1 transcriptional regulator [Alkalihalobacillus alcalophilus ATCC 27647 = CGMCC 1.3604]MED1560786.1 response regulator [Alkalihalobacillus alcalophilus]THG92426.1 transcriptional regulator [Alkalihalobacillus alcalophilus ATCC 27647 = CGMCC 1.3604]
MNVLISEDDYRVADIHRQYLQNIQGVNVIAVAKTAQETLELVQLKQPDVVLLDVYLPDELGINIMDDLRKACLGLQIVLITAATDKEVLQKAYQYGVVDYLVKPIALERLADAVAKAKKNRQLLHTSNDVTQQLLDEIFQPMVKKAKEPDLPKGIDQLTLEKVKALLKQQTEGITAEALGHLFGASRTTSRRYLEYLISIDEARAELVYGIVGRPERKYQAVNK